MSAIICGRGGSTTVYVNSRGGTTRVSNVGNTYVGFGPFSGEPGYDGYLFRPAKWCKEQWKDWAKPIKSGDSPIRKTIQKVIVFVPLVFLTVAAFFLKLVGLCANWHTFRPDMSVAPSINTIVGSGRVIEKTWPLNSNPIHSIAFSNSVGSLSIEKGEENSLKIEGEDNLLDCFSSYTLQNRELTVGQITPHVAMKLHKTIRYTLTVASFPEELKVFGGGYVLVPALHAPRFHCHIQGSGKVVVQKGEVSSQSVEISGSGKYKASNLKTDHSKIAISGSGSARVQATSSIEAKISGSGRCVYSGQPQVTSRISGSGRIFKSSAERG
jgi:hypothetical protein